MEYSIVNTICMDDKYIGMENSANALSISVMSHKIGVHLLSTWLSNSNKRRWKIHTRLVEACGGV